MSAAVAGVAPAHETPDALAPPPHHRRFPLLDGMRAIAVFSVLVSHVFVFSEAGTAPLQRALSHLNVGVTIFFLISGFLLYRPFIAHRTGGAAAPEIGQYAKRRVLRIFPAYWLALIVISAFPWTTVPTGSEWLTHATLIQTLPFGDPGRCDLSGDCGIPQAWSLVVELTFYALLPLWVLISERLARGRTTAGWVGIELAGLGSLAVVSVVMHFGVYPDSGTRSVIGGTVLGFGLWFALGMGLAVASVAATDRRRPGWVQALARRPWLAWAGALGVYALLCAELPATPFLVDEAQQLWTHLGFAAVALLLMLPAVFADYAGGALRRALAAPVVAWLGLISYGIFLWHYAFAAELGALGVELGFWPLLAGTVALSVAAGAASYYALERPVLKLKYRRAARTG